MMLNRLSEMQKRLKATSSTTEKQKIVSEYEDLKDILNLIYDPYKKFHLTSENVKKTNFEPSMELLEENLIDVFVELTDRIVTGHEAIKRIKNLINGCKEHEELILDILDKDLGCGISDSIINKSFPNLIPTFDVALGESYKGPGDFQDGVEYVISRKLDGQRILIFVDESGVTAMSRTGNEVFTIDELKEVFKGTIPELVYDGELCKMNGDIEDFQGIMRLARRKDFSIPLNEIRYCVFDVLTIDEFNSKTSKSFLPERLKRFTIDHPSVKLLEQVPLNDESFSEWQKKVEDNNWEGLILRAANKPYKGKRSKDILKVKKFNDMEVLATGTVNSAISFAEDGVVKKETMLSYVTTNYGNLKVGGGFTREQRRYFRDNPNEIVGQLITVKYFEKTTDENGIPSLRFPVYKSIVPSKDGKRSV